MAGDGGSWRRGAGEGAAAPRAFGPGGSAFGRRGDGGGGGGGWGRGGPMPPRGRERERERGEFVLSPEVRDPALSSALSTHAPPVPATKVGVAGGADLPPWPSPGSLCVVCSPPIRPVRQIKSSIPPPTLTPLLVPFLNSCSLPAYSAGSRG